MDDLFAMDAEARTEKMDSSDNELELTLRRTVGPLSLKNCLYSHK
jgi:hypothetical protein